MKASDFTRKASEDRRSAWIAPSPRIFHRPSSRRER